MIAALLLCVDEGLADPVKNVEINYLYQMEEGTLIKFWKRDMSYIMELLTNGSLPTLEHVESSLTRCKFHHLTFKTLELHTDNVKLVFDPATLHVNFSQPVGFSYEIELLWEFDLLYFPISGTATFKGVGINVNYTLNISQPFEGKLLTPGFDCDWKVTSAVVSSPVGSLFNIPKLVTEMFASIMDNEIMDYITADIVDEIPLKYEEYYAPKADIITYSGLQNQQVEVMRRFKRLYIDSHLLAVVYQERVEHVQDSIKAAALAPVAIPADVAIDFNGILRRYMRDFHVFEQIANKTLDLISKFKLTDADLPVNQKTRLNSEFMTTMLPNFTEKYGPNANVTLYVTGVNKEGTVALSRFDSLLVRLEGLVWLYEFYVKEAKTDTLFLTVALSSTLTLKPIAYWQAGAVVLNFNATATSNDILWAKTAVFESINQAGIKKFADNGMFEFLSSKCPNKILGDGLKIRDELGGPKAISTYVEANGATFNTWVYQTS